MSSVARSPLVSMMVALMIFEIKSQKYVKTVATGKDVLLW